MAQYCTAQLRSETPQLAIRDELAVRLIAYTGVGMQRHQHVTGLEPTHIQRILPTLESNTAPLPF